MQPAGGMGISDFGIHFEVDNMVQGFDEGPQSFRCRLGLSDAADSLFDKASEASPGAPVTNIRAYEVLFVKTPKTPSTKPQTREVKINWKSPDSNPKPKSRRFLARSASANSSSTEIPSLLPPMAASSRCRVAKARCEFECLGFRV
jgi:hypothetical protein